VKTGKNMSIVKNFFSKRTGFGFLMVFSTLSLAGTAAYYSVFGLSSLFAGAKFEVIIMASALELAKLIVASYLHNHWSKLGLLLKSYLTLGVGILMIITSAGIYGFLTSAYQTTADQLTIVDKQVAVVEMKRDRFSESLEGYKIERNQLNNSITELTKGLSNNTIQYTDSLGRIITTTSSSTRRVLTAQLDDMKEQRDRVSIKMETVTDSITKLDLQILDLESNNEVAAEIGPLRYMANITGKSMDVIVNWFTLMIVFVFDPMAIAMVIAVNKFFGNGRKEEDDLEDYYKERNKMLHKHTMMNEKKRNQEEMIKRNEEILATEKVSDKWEVEDTAGNVEVYPKDEERMEKKEFLEKLDEVEESVKKKDERIYREFSKPYSDGTYANETDLETDNDDIKTY
jgi:cytochrome c oxidase subunit IV